MASIREELIEAITPKESVRQEGNMATEERHHRWLVRDDELPALKAILTGEAFGDIFYNVGSEIHLVWDVNLDSFVELTTGDEYFITVFHDKFDDLVQSALDWTFANMAGANDWNFGTDGVHPDNTNGMYISSDAGVTNDYLSGGANAGESHASVDIVVPAGTEARIRVKLKCNGVFGTDQVKVFAYNAVTVPVADTPQNVANQVGLLADQLIFEEFDIDLPASFTGTTITVSFQWENNTTIEINPPAHIAEVELLYK